MYDLLSFTVNLKLTRHLVSLLGEAFYLMVQLASFGVPKVLGALSNFLIELTTLKRVYDNYNKHCVKLQLGGKAAIISMTRPALTSEHLEDVLSIAACQNSTPCIKL